MAGVTVGGARKFPGPADRSKRDEVDEFGKDEEGLCFLVLRQPPPMGTLRRAPPLVQYLLQVLQKCLGWVKL